MNAIVLVQVSPQSNPDTNVVKVTPSGNYTSGTPDPLPKLGDIPDPNAIGQVPMPVTPLVTPSVKNSNTNGYYAQVQRIGSGQSATFGLRWYASEGSELGSGAYPAAISGGEIFVEVLVPVALAS